MIAFIGLKRARPEVKPDYPFNMRRQTMPPYEVYLTYLAMKKHFTDKKYDYFRYNGKTRTSITAFNKRKDKYFFERMSRKLNDDQINKYFISNFVSSTDPSTVWVGDIIQNGEQVYKEFVKKIQSMTYLFKQDCSVLFNSELENNLDAISNIMEVDKGHPLILKAYLSGEISIETITIFDIIFEFCNKLDKKLSDPVWESVMFKIKKYRPFINTDISKCKTIIKEFIYV